MSASSQQLPPSLIDTQAFQAEMVRAGQEIGRAVVREAQDNIRTAGLVKTAAGIRSVQLGSVTVAGSTITIEVVAGGGGAAYIANFEEGTGLYGPLHRKYRIAPRFKRALAWPSAAMGPPGGEHRRLSGAFRTQTLRRIQSGQIPIKKAYQFARSVMHPGVKPVHYMANAIGTVLTRDAPRIVNDALTRALARL